MMHAPVLGQLFYNKQVCRPGKTLSNGLEQATGFLSHECFLFFLLFFFFFPGESNTKKRLVTQKFR